jgi:hypothetical protein
MPDRSDNGLEEVKIREAVFQKVTYFPGTLEEQLPNIHRRNAALSIVTGSGGGPAAASAPPLTVVTNWAAGLKE